MIENLLEHCKHSGSEKINSLQEKMIRSLAWQQATKSRHRPIRNGNAFPHRKSLPLHATQYLAQWQTGFCRIQKRISGESVWEESIGKVWQVWKSGNVLMIIRHTVNT